jgi:hypothetical protein
MARGESFDQMLARVQAKRAAATIASRRDISEGSIGMPPFQKKSVTKDEGASASPPPFVKKFTSRRVTKSAPAQKALRAGRALSGGGR